ncbi:hypothetical protein PC129_g15065 [Phytophthora cactorum]|uniref:Uncharacterized protein n=1 Tax=Phytophthora cactorum TaxID=29920 RepID=A0A8T1DTC9_9STRA|nr:hypothetical protein Pcac1_g15340 [Phytophthora cactorum]KAG2806509.1 hypothetical protein PC112_g17810 [Phytophthora cactorum]KAG2810826.1 hypothetical protein PC111_g15495 [Phytophthora cactorum]KAG2850593.1 hypothetical protein PC113_g16642 [Phytophthora cactorum]KAG2897018.1 hypothetical protein PC115_g17348 [Phytophthora cactorum]
MLLGERIPINSGERLGTADPSMRVFFEGPALVSLAGLPFSYMGTHVLLAYRHRWDQHRIMEWETFEHAELGQTDL